MKKYGDTPKIHVIGVASGIGGPDPSACMGPLILQTSSALTELSFKLAWQEILYNREASTKLAAIFGIADLCERIANETSRLTQQHTPFVVIGGDHSCAIGTWSGVAIALRKQGSLGLIWIDAHMDSHTPETSHSKNVHGMPLACLLGSGVSALTHVGDQEIKILPQHVCLIGVRSFEPEEAELLERLQVRVFFRDEVKERGLDAVFADALAIVKIATAGYGISIDLDAIDPHDAPGVSTPELNGIAAQELLASLQIFKDDSKLMGIEIVEFDPNRDESHKTEKLIGHIIERIF